MQKHTVIVVLGDKSVVHLPREFSQIVWYYVVVKSVLKWLVADNIMGSYAEEWRFHAS